MAQTHFQQNSQALALAGATVVITRPSAASASLKRRVRALGGTPLGLPAIGVRAATDASTQRVALRAAREVDMAIFVSPNAVRYAFVLLPSLRFARSTRICAIGAATARALQRHGVHDVLWPNQRQDSEGLLGLPELTPLKRRRIALIGAPGGRELLSSTLRRRGALLQSIDVYRRTDPRLDRRHLDALNNAAAPLLVLLSSAQALANLQRVLPPPLFSRLAAGEGIVSSLRLAEAARSAGFARTHIAASAGTTDMLDASLSALAQHRL
jgi:uroporphyrinogen-III synthase